jgi:uncharacterized membrane protein YsdA (DUF1294 family)
LQNQAQLKTATAGKNHIGVAQRSDFVPESERVLITSCNFFLVTPLALVSSSNLLRLSLLTGAVGFILMGVDKALAVAGWGDRISERTFHFVAVLGGYWGIILGGVLFHHKTSKRSFWPPVGVAAILWIILTVVAPRHLGGISV